MYSPGLRLHSIGNKRTIYGVLLKQRRSYMLYDIIALGATFAAMAALSVVSVAAYGG